MINLVAIAVLRGECRENTEETSFAVSVVEQSEKRFRHHHHQRGDCSATKFRRGSLNKNLTPLRLQCRHELHEPLATLTIVGEDSRPFAVPGDSLCLLVYPSANSQHHVMHLFGNQLRLSFLSAPGLRLIIYC